MRKTFKIAIVCFAALLACFVVSKTFHVFKSPKKHRHQHKYHKPIEEKPFVVVVPSFNNSAYCEKNLRSIYEQKYTNFRVIYIDDASNDDTFAKVSALITELDQWRRTTLIHNKQNQGALANLYRAVHSCKDQEIVVSVDGDDFLAHEKVLEKLNRFYANPHVWMTYGNYVDYPSYAQKPAICKKLPKKILQNNGFRKYAFVTSHLKTYYATLFKQIPVQDLFFQGNFFPMASDVAYMLPMLEMAGKHALFIREVLYLYNRDNPISDHKVNFALQEKCQQTIRRQHPYLRLKTLPVIGDRDGAHAPDTDLILFSYNRPLQLYALLESIETYVRNVQKIAVIYRAGDEEIEKLYGTVRERFPTVDFHKQSNSPEKDFRSLVLQLAFNPSYSPSHYLAFAVDDMVVTDEIDLNICTAALKETGAYGFYLGFGKHLDYSFMSDSLQGTPPLIPLKDTLLAWQFKLGRDDWKYPNSLDLVLYSKEKIKSDFAKIDFHNPNTLESNWARRAKFRRIGLCFPHSKCVNIPFNIVNLSANRHLNSYSAEDLLKKFREGLKLDIAPLAHIEPRSRHISYDPTFIPR